MSGGARAIARAARAALLVAAAAAVAAAGGCRPSPPIVEGLASRPSFSLGTELVLRSFTVLAWEDGRWGAVWSIELGGEARGSTRVVQYGVVPEGYTANVPARYPTLPANRLYTFHFEGAAVRADGIFAIVERAGAPAIVQLDNSKSLEDILKEFEALVRKPFR